MTAKIFKKKLNTEAETNRINHEIDSYLISIAKEKNNGRDVSFANINNTIVDAKTGVFILRYFINTKLSDSLDSNNAFYITEYHVSYSFTPIE